MNAKKRNRLRKVSLKDAEIKKNINFLDKPMWLPHKSNDKGVSSIKQDNKEFTVKYEDGSGYSIRSGDLGLPNYEDIKWLNFMLYKLQKQKGLESYTLEFNSFYEIMKEMGISTTNSCYIDNFIESLNRWKQVELEFKEGTFYVGKKVNGIKVYRENIVIFKVLGTVAFEYEKQVNKNQVYPRKLKSCLIYFDSAWVKSHEKRYSRKNSILPCFYMTPLAYRLYEILSKSFWNRQVVLVKFFGKTLDKKLVKSFQDASHRRRELIKALCCINDNSKMNFILEIQKKKKEGDLYAFTKK